MRIAVTYEDEKVFQHFGHTEKFKLYDVEDDEILSSEVFDSNGSGHGALAGLLSEHDIDTLICGGLGDGAYNALTEAGIEVIAGVEGSCDEAVAKYIKGELVSTGVNCDHHDHAHDENGCGSHCGGRFDPAKIPDEPGSSGWYKMVENDVINGYAIYGEGTDRMQIEHNLIGKCRASGYYAKPVSFRVSKFQRGGTSRDAVFLNNLFYDCGIAAITMPTEKNRSEGNLFVKMGGGYLRIMYPAPEVCLDLKSWQEFYGFDMNAQEAWFDIDIDTTELTLTVKPAVKGPFSGFGPARKNSYNTADEITKVQTDSRLETDFSGNNCTEKRLPGPFENLKNGFTCSIDPRKK